MPKRRTKGDGGLIQRHDHPTCPPLVVTGHDELGRPHKTRADHHCLGRWCGTFDVAIGAGKSRRVYVYGRTQDETNKKLKAAVRKRDEGAFAFDDGMTVAAWMEAWLESRRKPPKPLKPQTWNTYVSKTKNWITPYLGHIRLSKLRAGHIEELYNAIREAGRAEGTVRYVHAVLTKALKDAHRKGLISATPMERVDPPGSESTEREQFTFAEAKYALKAAGDSARWWLALFYGMRQAECLGLDWSNVFWDRHTLKVAETVQRDYGGGATIKGKPKTKAGERELPMVGQIETRLRLLWEEQGRPRVGPVFVNTKGDQKGTKYDWEDWRAFLDEATVIPFAPLPQISLHGARGTASSLMEAAGLSDRMVAQILGHANVKVTHGYQHADLERLRGELERVETLVASTSRLGLSTGSEA
jgi:integrase